MSKPYEMRIIDFLRNFREVAKLVKDIVKRIDPGAEVYVFGSVVTGKYTAASDIDMLVIINDISKKYEIIVEVYRNIEAPIELHVITRQQFERWYRRFINEDELIKV